MKTKPRRKGFNLIEAAIVLGVVGLVIGGIWVAAAAVAENKKWTDTQAGWVSIMQYVAKTFQQRGMVTNEDIQHMVILAKQIPPGWSASGDGSSVSHHPVDPYGNVLYLQTQSDGRIMIGYSWQVISGPVCGKIINMANQLLAKQYKITYQSANSWGGACSVDLGTATAGEIQEQCCPANGWGFYFEP